MIVPKLTLLNQMRNLLRAALEVSERNDEPLIAAHIGQTFGHVCRKIRPYEAAMGPGWIGSYIDNEVYFSIMDQRKRLREAIIEAIGSGEILQELGAVGHLNTALDLIGDTPMHICHAND